MSKLDRETEATVAELQRSEAKYRSLVESAPDAIVVVDERGRIVLLNARAERLFGYMRAELLGQAVEVLVPVRLRGTHIGHRSGYVAHHRAREMGTEINLVGLHKNGTEFQVDISLSPITTDEGTLVAAAIRDITIWQRAEEKFRRLVESAPDAMVIADRHGTIVLVNSQTERLFGYLRADLIGQQVELIVPVRFRAEHQEHLRHYFREPHARTMGAGLDLYGLRADGREFPVEISLSPLTMEEGVLVSSSIRDISERKRVEQALHDKNLELEKANLAKDRFLATMSHELRTPLNAVIGFTGTLLMKLPGPLTDDQQRQLQTIQSSARHLLSLINDLLDLAKIESGKIEIHFEPVSCDAAIDELAATLRPLASTKGLAFEVNLPAEETVVLTDRRALSQIVMNLASNAIKFTEHGTVRLDLEQTTIDGTTRTAFNVTDTGIGIRAEDQLQLFQAFQQANGGRRDGTGLGLYLSRKLAELLGGRIEFESEHGRGSRFTLVI